MKSGKLSPLLVALMTLMAGILAGMAYFVVQEGTSVIESPPTLLALGGVIVMAVIGMVMVTSTRQQLHEQAAQNERNQAAILQLLDELADVILMDVVMPGINGFQATRQITRSDSTRHIPVVIVSSKNQDADRVWGERQGACGYLTKPVDDRTLNNTVNGLLG